MARWMDIAWAEVGTAEIPGAKANPRILEYFAAVGHPEISSDEVAWCAAATGYCLSKGGVSLDAVPPDLRLRARAYLNVGTAIDTPRVGAICVLARHVASDPGAAHVGLIAGFTDAHVHILSGNQHDSFNVTAFPRAQVIGYRWPETVTPADLDRAGSRITTAARQQASDVLKIGGLQTTLPQLPPKPPGMSEIAQKATEAMAAFEVFQQFAIFAWGKLPFVGLMLTVFWLLRMAWNAIVIRQARAHDASTGAHTGRDTNPVESTP